MKFSSLASIILLLVVYISLFVFIQGKIPEPEKIGEAIIGLYKTYGYPLLLIGAIIEGIFLVGNYFPGSAILLIGAAVSKNGTLYFPFVVMISVVGLSISYTINYLLGRYGWYHVLSRFGLEQGLATAEKKLKSNEIKTFTIGYISITTAAFISTAAGVMRLPYKRFIVMSVLCQLVWSLLWGSVAYMLGFAFVELLLKYLVYVFLVVGIVYVFRYSSKLF